MELSNMTGGFPEYFDRLRDIYAAMDDAYDAVAQKYGFTCDHCPDNCCLTRFYNLTYLEYYYLLAGVGQLPAERQQQIRRKAQEVVGRVAADEAAGRTPRHMCPLNVEGRCGLHSHRLMICRLHGIPHEFRFPDGRVSYGEGCSVFGERCGDRNYIVFDRTLFYQQLSSLEKDFRQAAGINGKIKMTIAQMIVAGFREDCR
jgi:hypothetical protein